MADYDFDFLVTTCRSAVGKAHRSGRGRQEAGLQRVIEVGDDGEPKYITWFYGPPTDYGGERNHGLMRLSFTNLPSRQMTESPEHSVEFDREIRESPEQGEANASRPYIVPCNKTIKRKDCLQRMRSNLRDSDGGAGDVTVDNVVLKEMNDIESKSFNSDGIEENGFLLSQGGVSRLPRDNSSRTKRIFSRKSHTVSVLIGLLMAIIAALIIQMGVVTLH